MDGFDPQTGEILPATTKLEPALAKAIIEVTKHVKQLGSDDRNQHGGYAFVSVDKFYDQIGKLMSDAGLAVLVDETASDVKTNERTDDRGNTKSVSWLFMRYELRFMHESGATSPPMRRSLALPISGPQAFGAAQSYVEKQFLRQVFKVPTGEKDADETAPQDGAAPTASAPRQQQRAAPQAAPASASRDEAIKRHREMVSEIDNAHTAPEIDEILRCQAWQQMEKHIHAADPGEKGDNVIAKLRDRANQRKSMLLAPPETEGYGDASA